MQSQSLETATASIGAATPPHGEAGAATAATRPAWGGLPSGSPEAALFEALRPVRRRLANADGFPPYIVLSDAQLADLCRVRPGTFEVLAQVRGVGQQKLAKYGPQLLAAVRQHAAELNLALREAPEVIDEPSRPRKAEVNRESRTAAEQVLFARGDSLGELCVALQLAPGTVVEHLLRWVVTQERPGLAPWVSDADLARVQAAAASHGLQAAKPLFQALNGELHYPYVRLAQGFLQAQVARERMAADD